MPKAANVASTIDLVGASLDQLRRVPDVMEVGRRKKLVALRLIEQDTDTPSTFGDLLCVLPSAPKWLKQTPGKGSSPISDHGASLPGRGPKDVPA